MKITQELRAEKLTFRQTLKWHWLLAGLYALGTLIVLWITVNRISEIPWRYYRYWQTAGGYLLVLAGYVGFNFLNFLLLRKSAWWRLLFIPSLIGFVVIADGLEPSIKKYEDSIKCTSQQKQIFMVCFLYAEQTGEYPDSLETLLRLGMLDEKLLTCPDNRWHNPGDIDYYYFGKGVKYRQEKPDRVLLQDKPGSHRDNSYRQSKVFFTGDARSQRDSFR